VACCIFIIVACPEHRKVYIWNSIITVPALRNSKTTCFVARFRFLLLELLYQEEKEEEKEGKKKKKGSEIEEARGGAIYD
jgi:hypothetical protein